MRRPRKATPPTTEAIDQFCAAFDDLFGRYEERRALRQYLIGLLLPKEHNKTLVELASIVPEGNRQALHHFLHDAPSRCRSTESPATAALAGASLSGPAWGWGTHRGGDGGSQTGTWHRLGGTTGAGEAGARGQRSGSGHEPLGRWADGPMGRWHTPRASGGEALSARQSSAPGTHRPRLSDHASAGVAVDRGGARGGDPLPPGGAWWSPTPSTGRT
jgi:hypothetical protein